jgi:hypothetical protein
MLDHSDVFYYTKTEGIIYLLSNTPGCSWRLALGLFDDASATALVTESRYPPHARFSLITVLKGPAMITFMKTLENYSETSLGIGAQIHPFRALFSSD